MPREILRGQEKGPTMPVHRTPLEAAKAELLALDLAELSESIRKFAASIQASIAAANFRMQQAADTHAALKRSEIKELDNGAATG